MGTLTERTPQEFYREICELREWFGKRQFWQLKPEQREGAIRAITLAYLNTSPDDAHSQDDLFTALDATLLEYQRRELWSLKLKITSPEH